MALEAGLLQFGRIPSLLQERRRLLSRNILAFRKVVRRLTKSDFQLLEALHQSGSISSAAKHLRPDQPTYRTQLQRRVKRIETLLRKTFEEFGEERGGI
jgi:hypothetical protein